MKTTLKTIIILAIIAFTLISCSDSNSNTTKPADPLTVIIANETGETIVSALARVPGTTGWGSNLLTQNLTTGNTRRITIPSNSMDSNFHSDILLISTTDSSYIRDFQVLTHDVIITFRPDDRYIESGPAGGFVFYDKGFYSDGWRYLEAAPASSEFNADWGDWVDVHGTQTGIGTGRNNTNLIVASQGGPSATGTAAQRCAALNINGFSDWFLPSRDELNLMYQNLHLQGQGGFGQGTNPDWWMNWEYWSSSQSVADLAWDQGFGNGDQSSNCKGYTLRVRAVRAF